MFDNSIHPSGPYTRDSRGRSDIIEVFTDASKGSNNTPVCLVPFNDSYVARVFEAEASAPGRAVGVVRNQNPESAAFREA
jgi:hypothetical protein